MNRIFFYGLFMDVNLLLDKGFHPELIGPAELPGYQIHIGNRASLIPRSRSTSYGMLIDLSSDELTMLYSPPDVRDYRPDNVDTILLRDHSSQGSLCYNLPPDKLGAETNPEYARQLSALVLELGFPAAYASEIIMRDDA